MSSPYSATWDTLDETNVPGWDGSHQITARAYDAHGNMTISTAQNVTVANTTATKYKATWSSSLVPAQQTYDPVAGTYVGAVQSDVPSSWWRLGETSGTTAAAPAGSITGTYTGGFTLAQTGALTGSGDTDKAVLLNGTSGYVPMGSATQLGSSDFTVEAWFKTSASAAEETIFFDGGDGTSACVDRRQSAAPRQCC